MTLVKRNSNPWLSLIDDFFKEDFDRLPTQMSSWKPAVNVLENEDNFSLEVVAPGMKREDFKIKVEKGMLTISSEKEESSEEKGDNYLRREYRHGSFSRSFTLPENVEMDGINAKYEDGVLRIVMPKNEEERNSTKEITVS